MKNGMDQLKKKFEEDPLQVLAVGTAGLFALAKIIDAVTSAQGRRAYSKQINHKIKQDRKANRR